MAASRDGTNRRDPRAMEAIGYEELRNGGKRAFRVSLEMLYNGNRMPVFGKCPECGSWPVYKNDGGLMWQGGLWKMTRDSGRRLCRCLDSGGEQRSLPERSR